MDGSHISSDMRYVLMDRQIADIIDDLHPEDLKFLAELITSIRDCDCGCRGRSHITVTTDAGRRRRLLSRPRRQPAVPDFEQQFRV
jgi:hypothetical protein